MMASPLTWSSLAIAVALGSTAPVLAQTGNLELGGHVAVVRLSEFDVTDTGVGMASAWRVTPIVAIDGALSWFPAGNNGSANARIERQERVLGLIGARSVIRRGNVELFGRARAGRHGRTERAIADRSRRPDAAIRPGCVSNEHGTFGRFYQS
jgi:hypothetical protein